MRTSETLLLDFIRQSPQFRIPVNQRRYAWTKRHCRQLWDDILDAGERQDVREHFLGPIMYVAAVDPLNAHWAPFMVYDGQQRLTTITLILKALSRHLKDDTAPDGFGPDQIGSEYLVNPFGKGDQHYRLVLKAGDAETLLALIHDRPLPAEPSSRIMDAHAFFETRIKQLGPDVSALCAGLRKLRIVAFQLKEGEDNPHRIFETMNTCGRDLTCADMIGNFILMPLDRERQERLYADHLRPIERGFERHGEEHFDVFIRDFLTLRTGEVPKQGEEYAAFKTHARSRRVEDAGPEALSADLRSCADHYRAMVLGEEPDAELALAFGELARLDMKPVWPFLLHLYGDYAGKRLSRHDLLTLTRLVTAYVMRRAVCGFRPAAPPPVFATASRSVDPERYVESVRAYFLCLPDGIAFPSDEAFRAELVSRNMYSFRHCEALLERLENDGRKERVPLSSFTVDHIMPQGEPLPDTWKAELGPDWAQTWQSLRHTLGNLTLTAFNPEMGNRPFRDKRDAEKGYRDSPLRLNADLRQAERWDGDAIRARGARLADEAVGIWKRPVLPDRVLEPYRTPAPAPAATRSSITRICVPARRCTTSSRRSGRRSSASRRRSAKSSRGTMSPTRRRPTSQTSCRRSAGSCSPSTCASTTSPTRAGLPPTSPISGSGATATSSWRWITPARFLTRWSSCDRPSRPSSPTAPRGAKASGFLGREPWAVVITDPGRSRRAVREVVAAFDRETAGSPAGRNFGSTGEPVQCRRMPIAASARA